MFVDPSDAIDIEFHPYRGHPVIIPVCLSAALRESALVKSAVSGRGSRHKVKSIGMRAADFAPESQGGGAFTSNLIRLFFALTQDSEHIREVTKLKKQLAILADDLETGCEKVRKSNLGSDEQGQLIERMALEYSRVKNEATAQMEEWENQGRHLGLGINNALKLLILADGLQAPKLREELAEYVAVDFPAYAHHSEWNSSVLSRETKDMLLSHVSQANLRKVFGPSVPASMVPNPMDEIVSVKELFKDFDVVKAVQKGMPLSTKVLEGRTDPVDSYPRARNATSSPPRAPLPRVPSPERRPVDPMDYQPRVQKLLKKVGSRISEATSQHDDTTWKRGSSPPKNEVIRMNDPSRVHDTITAEMSREYIGQERPNEVVAPKQSLFYHAPTVAQRRRLVEYRLKQEEKERREEEFRALVEDGAVNPLNPHSSAHQLAAPPEPSPQAHHDVADVESMVRNSSTAVIRRVNQAFENEIDDLQNEIGRLLQASEDKMRAAYQNATLLVSRPEKEVNDPRPYVKAVVQHAHTIATGVTD